MNTICGIGLPELILLGLLGFVLIGPERSQDVALKAGRFLRLLVRSTWWKEFNEVTNSLRNLPQTLVRMAEIEDAQSELRSTMGEINKSIRIDFPSDTQPPTKKPTTISDDPWGIENAVAQTEYTPTPKEAPASSSPDTQEDNETDND